MIEASTVFGANGFIGRRLAERLRESSPEVICPRRDFDPKANRMNLGNVYYCVGVTGSDFRREQFNVVEGHVSMMARILEHGQFTSFTYLSTTRVHSRSQEKSEGGHEFLVDPSNISDFYNLSKLLGEALVLNCGKPTARVARLSYVVDFSPTSTDEVTCLMRAARSGWAKFDTHPETVKNYVLLGDVVNILPRIASHGKSRLYEIASSENTPMRDIGTVLTESTGCRVTYQADAPKYEMQKIDISALVNEFGYSPHNLLSYVRDTLLGG